MLKEIRESRGMSQQDLADKSGINKRMIQAYEQGYRSVDGAKLATLVTLCVALECHLSEIVDDAQLVKDLKAAVPVMCGEWVEAKSGVMSVWPPGQVMCSVCGQRMPSQWKKMPPYCYGCGAKMEEKP